MKTTQFRGFTIIRRDNAQGTNLADKSQPVISVIFPNGHSQLLGAWSSMSGKPATECSDAELVSAIVGDESVFKRL